MTASLESIYQNRIEVSIVRGNPTGFMKKMKQLLNWYLVNIIGNITFQNRILKSWRVRRKIFLLKLKYLSEFIREKETRYENNPFQNFQSPRRSQKITFIFDSVTTFHVTFPLNLKIQES